MNRIITIALLTAFATSESNFIKDDDAAIDAVARATIKYKLTPIPVECLYFDTDDKGNNYLVRVWEKHDKKCGGDPGAGPIVFFMNVRKSDGHLTTNAYHPENSYFEELKPDPDTDIETGSP